MSLHISHASMDGTTMERRRLRTIAIFALGALLTMAGACADQADSSGAGGDGVRTDAGGTGGASGGGSDGTTGGTTGGSPPPEQEEEFEFSTPAVVGGSIYVANETLNSAAVIDSDTLSIDNLLVGYRPTKIVGPEPRFADSDTARVMVLNEGSSSVTVIDPQNRQTENFDVMDHANALEMDPSGRYGVAWYDTESREQNETPGDLSSVTVVTAEASYRVAVGFHVRDVLFDRQGERALVWTDAGVSPIDFSELDGDTASPPIPLVPSELDLFQPEQLEIKATPHARFVVTRSTRMRGVVLLDVQTREHYVVPLFEVPTDVDLIGEDDPEALLMLRASDRAVRADLPSGLVEAADALEDYADDVPVEDASTQTTSLRTPTAPAPADTGVADTGSTDVGDAVADADDTSTGDTSTADTSVGDVEVGDTGVTDASDADVSDTGTSDTTDAGSDADGGGTPGTFPTIRDFEVIDVSVPDLGSAVVGKTAETAMLYTTVRAEERAEDERRIVLLDLADGSQRIIALQKKVRGAISDERGETFIVFNQRVDKPIPPDASPQDPEYIARSWGITLVDIESAATRLLLTKKEPGPTALWSPEQGASKVYVTFDAPPNVERSDSAFRDVIEVNLETFRQRVHRLPSIPEGLGPIQPAGEIFISQRHPQGRMTFIDVESAERQTITGYQLNSKIE